MSYNDSYPILWGDMFSRKTLINNIESDDFNKVRETLEGGAFFQKLLRIPLIGNLVSKIRRLIFLKPKISARNKDGETALICAVKKGNVKIVDILTKAVADRNEKKKALIFAAEKGYTLKIIMKEELEANVELQNIFNSNKKENRQTDDGCTVESPPAFLAKSAVIQGNQQTTSTKILL